MTGVTDFRTATQVSALATLLDVDENAVAHLGRFGAEFVHDLRLAISDHLFDGQAHLFKRVSKLAPLAPNGLVAKIVPGIVPPLVAGRAAGALGVDHPDRIDDLLGRLTAEYMATCAPHLDPRAVAKIAPNMKGAVLVPAACILLANRDYVTVAGFVEFATEDLVSELIDGIDDFRGVVLAGALVYSDAALELVIRGIPFERFESEFSGILADREAAISVLSIASRLDAELRAELLETATLELAPAAESVVRDLSTDPTVDPALREVALDLLSTQSRLSKPRKVSS